MRVQIDPSTPEADAKASLIDDIREYLATRITAAHKELVRTAVLKVSGCPGTLLRGGHSGAVPGRRPVLCGLGQAVGHASHSKPGAHMVLPGFAGGQQPAGPPHRHRHHSLTHLPAG